MCSTETSPVFQKCIVLGKRFTLVKEIFMKLKMYLSEKSECIELIFQGMHCHLMDKILSERSQDGA